MYIEKIKIDKFRVLEDIEIHFQPPGGATADPETGNVVNVIAGVNGSGKTSLLECLREAVEYNSAYNYSLNANIPLTTAEWIEPYTMCVMPNSEASQTSTMGRFRSLKLGGLPNENKSLYKVYWNCQDEMFDLIDEEKKQFPQSFISYGEKIVYFEFGWVVRNLQKDRNNILDAVEKTITNFVLDAERISDKPAAERISDAIEKFNRIFEGVIVGAKLKSIKREGSVHKAIFSTLNDQEIDLKDLSDGEKSLYFTVGILMSINNLIGRVILMDEPEVALHPAWQQKITKILSRIGENNQFIVATHSPQIIANTPYQNLIVLNKKEGKIIAHNQFRPPIGTDANSILADFMGISGEYPEDVMQLHREYRKFVEDGKENSPEAIAVKKQLLEKETNDSRFMQEMRILMRLRGKK